ncbi:MAG: YqgE/AlgH family protein [Bacteroidia bacterium]|jgi:putative transcriptional regulator
MLFLKQAALNLIRIDRKFDQPHKGSLLLSEPFLDDMKFRRTVVLLGEHSEDGTVGFVLNRLLNITTRDVVPDLLLTEHPVYYGGPVEPNTLHFIHKSGDLIDGSQQIANGIYWGGDIGLVNDLIKRNVLKPEDFKFFIGYSGWESGQLIQEIENKAWWLTESNNRVVFDDDLENMWSNLVRTLGPDFAYMADSPEDPQWN